MIGGGETLWGTPCSWWTRSETCSWWCWCWLWGTPCSMNTVHGEPGHRLFHSVGDKILVLHFFAWMIEIQNLGVLRGLLLWRYFRCWVALHVWLKYKMRIQIQIQIHTSVLRALLLWRYFICWVALHGWLKFKMHMQIQIQIHTGVLRGLLWRGFLPAAEERPRRAAYCEALEKGGNHWGAKITDRYK